MKNLIPSGGMDLDKALTAFRAQLKHKRVIYVIQANLDKGKVTKFGIAGMDSGNPFSRLGEYVLMYGKYNPKNECQGVKVFFLGTVEYNRLVEQRNSKIFKLERKLKDEFKTTTEHVGRGLERTNASPAKVIEAIKKYEKNIQDVETEIVREARDSTKKYRTDRDAFINSRPSRRSERLKETEPSRRSERLRQAGRRTAI